MRKSFLGSETFRDPNKKMGSTNSTTRLMRLPRNWQTPTKPVVFQSIDMLKEKLTTISGQLDRIKDQMEAYEVRNPEIKNAEYKDIFTKLVDVHLKAEELSQALRFGIK